MLQTKWAVGITNDDVFQREKEEKLLFNSLKKIDATHG
jgi:hypothetical protein